MYLAKILKNDLYETDWRGRILLPLLLLFPVLSLSVRHWLSGIFSLIVLLALISIWKRGERLCKEEKILFLIFALFILSFFISATINGWTDSSFRRIGTEFKYLMFFPLYLLIRQYPRSSDWLILGVGMGAIILGIQALHDTFFTSYQRGKGIYGPIIFGDLAILFAVLSAIALRYIPRNSRYNYILYVAAIILGLLATYFSGSRNAWLAAILLLLILPFYMMARVQIRKLLVVYILVVMTAGILVYLGPDKLVKRAEKPFEQYSQYTQKNIGEGELSKSSIGFRLEQWRVSLLLFGERPVFGFGAGNSGREINRYVKAGLAHPDLYNEHAYTRITGVHSAYLEVLVTEGLVGTIILLLILLYPAYIFIRHRDGNQKLSDMDLILILSFMIFSLTENPFVHDNFTSVYLVFLAVLYSGFINSINQYTGSNKSLGP